MVEVYIATYTGVDVYESEINKIPLMRRCSDDWVNATQILKIAGYGKAQRTRVLEREIHCSTHQKIQGGYGRFQGTWVPLEYAIKLASIHKLQESDLTVLHYNPKEEAPLSRKPKNQKSSATNSDITTRFSTSAQPNDPSAATNSHDDKKDMGDSAAEPRKKRQYAKRKNAASKDSINPMPKNNNNNSVPVNNMNDGGHDAMMDSNNEYPRASTFYNSNPHQQQIQMVMASQAQNIHHQQHPNQQQQQNMNPTPPRVHLSEQHQQRLYHPNTFGSLSTTDGSQDEYHLNRNNSDTSNSSDFEDTKSPYPMQTHNKQLYFQNSQQSLQHQQQHNHQQQMQHQGPPQAMFHQNYQMPMHHQYPNQRQSNSMSHQQQLEHYDQAGEQTDIEDDEDDLQLKGLRSDGQVMDDDEEDDYYTDRLLTFFSSDSEPVPDFLMNPPVGFDINKAIDNEGHAPLHWASSLAIVNIVELLLSNNANPLVLNLAGTNSLCKSVQYTNSYDMKNFHTLLNLLNHCLIVPDAQERTVLHYLMEVIHSPNKYNCVMYYYNEIVNFGIAQQRQADRIQQQNGQSLNQNKNLLKILVNHQDNQGNTALHILLRGFDKYQNISQLKELVISLLQLGADLSILNYSNEPINIPYEILRDSSTTSNLLESQSAAIKFQQHLQMQLHQQQSFQVSEPMPLPLPSLSSMGMPMDVTPSLNMVNMNMINMNNNMNMNMNGMTINTNGNNNNNTTTNNNNNNNIHMSLGTGMTPLPIPTFNSPMPIPHATSNHIDDSMLMDISENKENLNDQSMDSIDFSMNSDDGNLKSKIKTGKNVAKLTRKKRTFEDMEKLKQESKFNNKKHVKILTPASENESSPLKGTFKSPQVKELSESPIKITNKILPGFDPTVSVTDKIRSFTKDLNGVLGTLTESFDKELTSVNDELKHNLKTKANIDKDIKELKSKNSKLIGEIFPDELDKSVKYNNTSNAVELSKDLQKKKNVYFDKYLYTNSDLERLYERSQSLELAELVHVQESKIESEKKPGNPSETKDKYPANLRLAVELSLLQIKRRKLINYMITSVGGLTKNKVSLLFEKHQLRQQASHEEDEDEDADDKLELQGLDKSELEQRKVDAKIQLNKKLLSLICNLESDEIDNELLTGIETRLLNGK